MFCMEELVAKYQELSDIVLPTKYTYPVRYNHCFKRIILDWLFSDCWYNYLDRKKPAVIQLDDKQLKAAINRMSQWISDQQLLISDNQNSLEYRKAWHNHKG